MERVVREVEVHGLDVPGRELELLAQGPPLLARLGREKLEHHPVTIAVHEECAVRAPGEGMATRLVTTAHELGHIGENADRGLLLAAVPPKEIAPEDPATPELTHWRVRCRDLGVDVDSRLPVVEACDLILPCAHPERGARDLKPLDVVSTELEDLLLLAVAGLLGTLVTGTHGCNHGGFS